MSGETEKNVSGWSVDTAHVHLLDQIESLRARLDEALTERDLRYEQRWQALQEAIAKADAANEKRFESVNEFRGQLQDQANKFMGREESIARHERTSGDVAELKERLWSMQGASKGATDQRAISNAALGLMIGCAALVISVVVIVVNILTSRG